MAEFQFEVPGGTVRGVCATDATEEVILNAIVADLSNAEPDEERRLDDAQVVYTFTPAEAPVKRKPATKKK